MTDVTNIPEIVNPVPLLRGFVFSAFFVLSVRSVFVYLTYFIGAVQIAGMTAAALVMALCWWRPLWMLYAFVACIPLVSGVQGLFAGELKFAPVLSFGFSILYVAWVLKRILIQKKRLVSQNKIATLIDLFAGIVFFSIIASLCKYPLDFVVYRLQFVPTLGLSDPFYFMTAGYIITQGLFLYRILDLEGVNRQDLVKYFVLCLYFHAVIIAGFAFVQLFGDIPDKGKTGSVSSPFQNVHALSGYVLILFFFFLQKALKNEKRKKIHFLLAAVLLVCILVSGSTTGLIALFVFGTLFLFFTLGRQKWIITGVVVGVIFVSVINLKPSWVPESKGDSPIDRYLQRLHYSTALEKLNGRFTSWDQALGIIREYPLTGSGVGSFFQISRYYHFSDTTHPWRIENAHNYYVQLAAEIGIPGLAVFLSILFFIYRAVLRTGKRQYVNGLIFGLSAYLFSMITDHHLLLSNHQFLFWFVLFGITFVIPKENFLPGTRYLSVVVLALLLLMPASHAFNLLENKDTAEKYEYGYYKYHYRNDSRMRWVMKQSCTELTATSEYLGFSVYTDPEYFDNGSVQVDIYINDFLLESLLLNQVEMVHKYYYIPGITGKKIMFTIKSGLTFNPYKKRVTKNLGDNLDKSIAITDVHFFHIPLEVAKKVVMN